MKTCFLFCENLLEELKIGNIIYHIMQAIAYLLKLLKPGFFYLPHPGPSPGQALSPFPRRGEEEGRNDCI